MIKSALKFAANMMCAGVVGLASLAFASEPVDERSQPNKLLVVYDSSNSMWGELADKSRKYEAGRDALQALVEADMPGVRMALRAYGHRRPKDCSDTELVSGFSEGEAHSASIETAVASMRPTGKTPITLSLRKGREDLGAEGGDILLISDGVETCDIDPCELMEQWASDNVSIRVHVVGVGLSALERDAMSCIADTSGGSYFDANSKEGFLDAITKAGQTVEQAATEPNPVQHELDYVLLLNGKDEDGNEYLTQGKLFQDGVFIDDLTSNGRNILPGPGVYDIEVGARLADGSVYEPRRYAVEVTERGEFTKEVIVIEPARVSALFAVENEEVDGALVVAFQNDVEVFSFRPFDTALAAPGAYEFRSRVNQDNDLTVLAELTAGEETVVEFGLVETVEVQFEFLLSDGQTLRRNSTLWRDGEEVYALNSGFGRDVVPGDYMLRSPDQNIPLTPLSVSVPGDGGLVQVPLPSAKLRIEYGGDQRDYFGNANRAFIASSDRGGSAYATPDQDINVAPGTYQVSGHKGAGFFAPQTVSVVEGDAEIVTLTPLALGELIVDYQSPETLSRTPDRAFVYALEGQPIHRSFLRPGESVKLLPGQYRVEGWRSAGNFSPEIITITAHELTQVSLQLASQNQ